MGSLDSEDTPADDGLGEVLDEGTDGGAAHEGEDPDQEETPEDEPEGEPEAGSDESGPAQEAPRKFAKKFNSADELERGYQNLESVFGKTAAEKAALARENAELKLRLSKHLPADEIIDDDKLTEAIANGTATTAIAKLVQQNQQREQQTRAAEYEQWRASKEQEFEELATIDPGVREIATLVGEAARQYPDKSVALLVAAIRKQQAESGQDKAKASEIKAAKAAGAKELLTEMSKNAEAAKVDARGKGGHVAAPAKLSPDEAKMARIFKMKPEEYAKWKSKD